MIKKKAIQPLISIILPVYNGQFTLQETLNSLKNQTFKEFELIICDDGSIDKSIEIINNYKTLPIKKLYNPINKGLGYTLNKLIDNVHPISAYIAMAEQDDYYYKDRLELQYEYMESNPDVGLISGIADHWDGEKISTRFPGLLVSGKQYPDGIECFKLNYREQCKVVNSCMMFRKSVHLENNLQFNIEYPSLSVDWDYILRFSLVSKISGLNKSLVRLDRRTLRNSLTTKNQVKFDIANRLINEFHYEFGSLINLKDYKYALATQQYIELSDKKYCDRLIELFKIFWRDPSIIRFLDKSIKIIIQPIKRSVPKRKILFDRLAWVLTRKKFSRAFQLIKLEDLYNFTESFIGYGYYNRISMSQKKIEIIKLAKIVKELQPEVILEIGTRKGGTLFMWARISEAKKIISIDLPGGPFGGGYAVQKRKLYKYFVNDTSTEMHLIQSDSHSEMSRNKVKEILQTTKIDFLFIDGGLVTKLLHYH